MYLSRRALVLTCAAGLIGSLTYAFATHVDDRPVGRLVCWDQLGRQIADVPIKRRIIVTRSGHVIAVTPSGRMDFVNATCRTSYFTPPASPLPPDAP